RGGTRIVAECLDRERGDVGVVIVGRPVGDAGADGDGGEAVRRGGQEGRDVAPLAPAHAADLGGIDPAELDEVIDAGQHVPGVADAEVADVELPELHTVAGAAAVVDAQDQGTPAGPEVGRVVAAGQQGGPVDARGAAVNDAQQRPLPRRVEIGRLGQHALDGRAVLALPGDDF